MLLIRRQSTSQEHTILKAQTCPFSADVTIINNTIFHGIFLSQASKKISVYLINTDHEIYILQSPNRLWNSLLMICKQTYGCSDHYTFFGRSFDQLTGKQIPPWPYIRKILVLICRVFWSQHNYIFCCQNKDILWVFELARLSRLLVNDTLPISGLDSPVYNY